MKVGFKSMLVTAVVLVSFSSAYAMKDKKKEMKGKAHDAMEEHKGMAKGHAKQAEKEMKDDAHKAKDKMNSKMDEAKSEVEE